ncbi:MAG: hypothetical protein K0S38_789 [Candidatus Paceibacter sp.]|jgi:hypothetical protein|nr:hypothetical protein [Candidatus Paceibacter sp.]
MTLSLIAFIGSGIGIVVLIGLKMLQEKMGMLLFWPDVREKGEVVLQRQADKVKTFADGFSKRNFYIFLHFVLTRVRAFFVYIQRMIDKRLVHLVNLIKGKQMLDSTRGKASHFLHDITRFKDKFRRQ